MYDPIFAALVGKDKLASQPTLSRFINRLTLETANQLEQMNMDLLDRVYSITPPKQIILDVDSTMALAFGKQYGRAYNKHYNSTGFHPLVAFNGETGDLLKVDNRSGNVYTSRNVVRFITPLLIHYRTNYPDIDCIFRGDSGFATPELFEILEVMDASYCIRLKSNPKLQKLSQKFAAEIENDEHLFKETTIYREFEYQAKSWTKARRVIVKISKNRGEMIANSSTFYITNLDYSPKEAV